MWWRRRAAAGGGPSGSAPEGEGSIAGTRFDLLPPPGPCGAAPSSIFNTQDQLTRWRVASCAQGRAKGGMRWDEMCFKSNRAQQQAQQGTAGPQQLRRGLGRCAQRAIDYAVHGHKVEQGSHCHKHVEYFVVSKHVRYRVWAPRRIHQRLQGRRGGAEGPTWGTAERRRSSGCHGAGSRQAGMRERAAAVQARRHSACPPARAAYTHTLTPMLYTTPPLTMSATSALGSTWRYCWRKGRAAQPSATYLQRGPAGWAHEGRRGGGAGAGACRPAGPRTRGGQCQHEWRAAPCQPPAALTGLPPATLRRGRRAGTAGCPPPRPSTPVSAAASPARCGAARGGRQLSGVPPAHGFAACAGLRAASNQAALPGDPPTTAPCLPPARAAAPAAPGACWCRR